MPTLPGFGGPDPDGAGAAEPVATWSVAELHEALQILFERSLGEVWVCGEMQSFRKANNGHCWFDLVDSPAAVAGPGGTPQGDAAPTASPRRDAPRLKVVLFDQRRRRVNAELQAAGIGSALADGTVLRIRAQVSTYPSKGELQLVMTGIDPAWILGVRQQQRDRVLAALAAEGLLGRNGSLAVPFPALRLAIVTSVGSAAHADVVTELERSGIGFAVTVLDARTQGNQAERSLVAALRHAQGLAVDAVLLVRGGGSRSDLAAFDGEEVARTIADLGVPVFTGIGHEIDRSVADEVAHTAHKTPTAAAAAMVRAAAEASRAVDAAAEGVAAGTARRLGRAGERLERQRTQVALAVRGHLGRESAQVLRRAGAVATAARRRTRTASAQVDHAAALVAANDPRRLAARGWSVTRTADGSLVRSSAEVVPGDRLVTELADGRITSTVDTTVPPPPQEPADDR